MKHNKKPVLFGFLYGAILLSFTVYAVLDTFVIPRAYASSSQQATVLSSNGSTDGETGTSAATGIETSGTADASDSASDTNGSTSAGASAVVLTDNTYSDGSVSITITTDRVDGTDIYIADITLSSASELCTAFADNTYGRNIKEKTSTIADSVDAILAINGDFYGSQESGYVIRNGVLYRDTSAGSDQEDLVIMKDGSFQIINEGEVTADELISEGAWQVLSFGPALVENGQVAVTSDEEVGKAMESNPRTAIGVIDDLHYVFVVSDGRTSESTGLSLSRLATYMQNNLGVTYAYNLDGGGSSTMVFNGTIINNPTTDGNKITERSVSDIVYIAKAEET